MQSEEKAKRKEKPKDTQFMGVILLAMIPLVPCLIICAISWTSFMRDSSDIPLLDGLSSGEQAEAIILERLPIGSTRAEVESFIAEQLQPSESCTSQNDNDAICLQVFGRKGICNFMVWYFEFHFENQLLSEIVVGYAAGCM